MSNVDTSYGNLDYGLNVATTASSSAGSSADEVDLLAIDAIS